MLNFHGFFYLPINFPLLHVQQITRHGIHLRDDVENEFIHVYGQPKETLLSDRISTKESAMRDCTVEKVAIDALNAASDYLLLTAIDGQLERVVEAICRAVETGGLSEKRLYEAGAKIRALAKKYRI